MGNIFDCFRKPQIAFTYDVDDLDESDTYDYRNVIYDTSVSTETFKNIVNLNKNLI